MQQNIYIGVNHVVYKLAGQTGKVIWQHALDPKAQELMQGMHIHVLNGAVYVVLRQDIYALDASTGKERWHTHRTDGYLYEYDAVSDGRIYLYGLSGTFSAVSTQNGAQLWHNQTFQTGRGGEFYVVHGTLYVLSDQEDIYAFNAATGMERWHFIDTHRPSAYAAPVVENGIVYFSMGAGNRFFALNEKNGQKVWEQQILADKYFDTFQIVNGIVYTSSRQEGIERDKKQYIQDEKIYAFDAKKGTLLWTSPSGYTLLNGISISAGLLIAQGEQNGVVTLTAFHAKDGSVAWQQNRCSSGACLGIMVYNVHGTGYFFEAEISKTDLPNKIIFFDWQSGKLLAQKSTHFDGSFGMSNGIVYQYEINGKSPANPVTDIIIYAIQLSDGSALWQYDLKDSELVFSYEPVIAP